jgi:hypothetical protein
MWVVGLPATRYLGLELGAALSGGGDRVGYDVHIGPTLGIFGSPGALYAFGGGGTDDANVSLAPAWYLYAGGGFDVEWAESFRTEVAAKYLWRTKDSSEQQYRGALAFACIGGEYPCWQFVVGGDLVRFPDVETTGWGIFLGARMFNRR